MSQAPGGHGLRYAPGLDGVRALAVAAVVAYHIGTTSSLRLLPGGFLGVDVFFVLSGYLITSLLVVEAQQHGRISIKNFYIRRARRLLPALFAVLLAVAMVGAFWLPHLAARLRGDLLASLGYVQNWWLILQSSSYFATVGDRPPMLTHLWSLSVEEQYYLIWPLVLVAFAAVRARQSIMLVIVLAGVAASTTAGLLLYDPVADPSRVYYGTDTRALAPLLGAALAIAVRPWHYRTTLPRAQRAGLDTLGLAGLAGLAVTAAWLRDTDELLYRGGFLAIAVMAAALVCVAGHPATLLGRALGTQPLRYLGERSYAIYLWHWPVCLVTRPGYDIPLTGWANAAARVAITIALAEASYHLIEKPIRRDGVLATLRRVRPAAGPAHRSRLVPLVRTALLAVALVGGGTAAGVGLVAASRPRPSDVAIDLDPSPSVPARPSPRLPIGARVEFFGDSQGTSLLNVENRPLDLADYIDAVDATTPGCGILYGWFTLGNGVRQDSTVCQAWISHWESRVDEDQPALSVVMVGAWETYDLTLSDTGEHLAFGSAAWDRHFRNALITGIDLLRGPRRAVALALRTCFRPPMDPSAWQELVGDERGRHINELMVGVAETYTSGVYIIDPPQAFCDDSAIATDTSYRVDGIHYTARGAAFYFQAMLPQILAPGQSPSATPSVTGSTPAAAVAHRGRARRRVPVSTVEFRRRRTRYPRGRP